MRILQIIQKKQYRGAEIFCCQLSNHLIDLGHIVEIVSIYDGDEVLPFKKKILSLNRKKSHRFIDYQGWQKLSNIIKRFQPDVVQANASDTLKYAVLSKLSNNWNIPIIHRNANITSFFIKSKFSYYLNSFLIKRVDAIISVSKSSKKDINKLFPFPSYKSFFVPVGIEQVEIPPFQYEAGTKNMVHVGSFTKEKNHEGLLRIFLSAKKSIPNLKLQLIGTGKDFTKIKKKIIKMNLQEDVYMLGGVSDPLKYIAAGDILVLPSEIEGLPAVILEAMYCKTAVIAYNVGGVSEIVTTKTGYLVPNGNEREFSEMVVQIMKAPEKVKVENAYSLVTNNYLNKALTIKFLDIYHSILEQRIK